jgi:hypothetical protein
MTLNQIIRRIRTIAEAHSQVRTFAKGLVTDFLTDKTTSYPAVFLQNSAGNISLKGQASTLNFRMFVVDLVHVSEETKDNETDVHSDMISIAMDILTQMNNGSYNDWGLSSENNLQLLVETDGDMFAGVYVDFSLRFMFKQNVCQVPTSKTTYQTTD